MKRLLLLLPVLLLAADKPVIEGWKVISGEWSKKGETIAGSGGTLLATVPDCAKAELSFRVHDWADVKLVAFFFSVNPENTRHRYQVIIQKQHVFVSRSEGDGFRQVVGKSIATPSGRWNTIQFARKKDVAIIRIGRDQPLRVPLDNGFRAGTISLHVDGAEVTFRVVHPKAG